MAWSRTLAVRRSKYIIGFRIYLKALLRVFSDELVQNVKESVKEGSTVFSLSRGKKHFEGAETPFSN